MSAVAHNPLLDYNHRLDYMHDALEHKHKGVPMLALEPEPEVLNKEPELVAIVAAPGGRQAVRFPQRDRTRWRS
jgi:hypothetical protein